MSDTPPDDETVDTGFDAVMAGERYEAPGHTDLMVSPEAIDEVVTATVTGLTPAGIEAAKSLVNLPVISPPELARLAREIAMNIKERHVVLQDFKLSESQYEFLEKYNEFYQAALRSACIEWQSPLSTTERIKVEAAAILEDSLIGLGARMQNRAEGLPGVVEVAKLFAKVAGVGEREPGQNTPGERFTINIDLGGDKKIVVASSPAPEQAPQQLPQRALPGDTET